MPAAAAIPLTVNCLSPVGVCSAMLSPTRIPRMFEPSTICPAAGGRPDFSSVWVNAVADQSYAVADRSFMETGNEMSGTALATCGSAASVPASPESSRLRSVNRSLWSVLSPLWMVTVCLPATTTGAAAYRSGFAFDWIADCSRIPQHPTRATASVVAMNEPANPVHLVRIVRIAMANMNYAPRCVIAAAIWVGSVRGIDPASCLSEGNTTSAAYDAAIGSWVTISTVCPDSST